MNEQEFERQRLARLAADSQDHDDVICELVYHDRLVRFEISSLELQHLDGSTLWTRYLVPAMKELRVPAPAPALANQD